jgi:predicted  nucleic acid-binding Zn-ribbon protein
MAALAFPALDGKDTFGGVLREYIVASFMTCALALVFRSLSNRYEEQMAHNQNLLDEIQQMTDDHSRIQIEMVQLREEMGQAEAQKEQSKDDFDASVQQYRDLNAQFKELQLQNADLTGRHAALEHSFAQNILETQNERREFQEEHNELILRKDNAIAMYHRLWDSNKAAQRQIINLRSNVPQCADALLAEPHDWTATVGRLTKDGRPDLRYREHKCFGLFEERFYTLVNGRRVFIQLNIASD